MKKKLVKNKDGLLSVNKKPSQQELKNLYKNLYYQKNLSKTYTTSLFCWINAKYT